MYNNRFEVWLDACCELDSQHATGEAVIHIIITLNYINVLRGKWDAQRTIFLLLDNSNTFRVVGRKNIVIEKKLNVKKHQSILGARMYNIRIKTFRGKNAQLSYYRNPVLTDADLANPRHTKIDPFKKKEKEFWFDYDYDVEFDDIGIDSDELKVISEKNKAEKNERSLVVSRNRSIRRIYDYGRANEWTWFFTLTFKEKTGFSRESYVECSRKLSNWFKNIKKNYCPNIKYLAVPEQHVESDAWHFHILVCNCDELTFTPAINNQEFLKDENHKIILNKKGQPVRNKYFGQLLRTSYPDGDLIYNIQQYKNGWSTATKIKDTDKAVSYITKYITKELSDATFGKHRYFISKGLDLPKNEYFLLDPKLFGRFVEFVEEDYGMNVDFEYRKVVKVDIPGYEQTVTILEFNQSSKGVDELNEFILSNQASEQSL